MTHGTGQAILGLGDENDSNSLANVGVTNAELTAHEADTSTHGVAVVAGTADIDTHAALTTGVHGAGASTVATTANITTHAGLTTGVHGVAGSTVASAADIATHAALDLAAAVHGFKGHRKFYADGLAEAILVTEIQTMDLGGADPVANGDTYKIALGAGATNKTALLTYTDAAAGVTHAGEIQAAIRLVAGYEAVTVAAVDANTFTITLVGVANPDQAQVTDTTGFTPDNPDATGVATSTPYVAATTYTVTGIAVGDILSEVTRYVNKASIATSTMRALGDYSITATNTVTVIANPADCSAPDLLLFEWTDLT